MRLSDESYKKCVELISEELFNKKNMEIEEVEKSDLKQNKFKKMLKAITDKNDDVFRRLADK